MASKTLLRPSFKHRSVYVSGSRSRKQSREIMEQSAIKAGILSPEKPFVPQTLKFDVLPTISEHGAPDSPRASDLPVFGSKLVLFSIKQQQDDSLRALSLFCFSSSKHQPKSIVMDYVCVTYKTTFSEVYNQMHFALCKSLHLFATNMNDLRTIPTPGPATMVLDFEGRTVREITESSWSLDKVTLAQGQAHLALVFPVVKAKRADSVSLEEVVQKGRQLLFQSVGRQVRNARSAFKGVELALESKIYKCKMRVVEERASAAQEVEAIQNTAKPAIPTHTTARATPAFERVATCSAPAEMIKMAMASKSTIPTPATANDPPVFEQLPTRTASEELNNMATASQKETEVEKEEPTEPRESRKDSLWEPTVEWWFEEEKPSVGRRSHFKEVGVDWPYGPYL